MVVGGQLDLELDGGGIVFRLAQVVLAPSAPLAAFDHEVLVSWENVPDSKRLRFYLGKPLRQLG